MNGKKTAPLRSCFDQVIVVLFNNPDLDLIPGRIPLVYSFAIYLRGAMLTKGELPDGLNRSG